MRSDSAFPQLLVGGGSIGRSGTSDLGGKPSSFQCMSDLLGSISGTWTGSTEHAAYVGQAGGFAGGIYCSLLSFWKSDVDLAGICTGRGRCNTDWNHSLAKRVG